MNVATRVWVPYGTHVDIPEEVLNVFDQVLGVPGIHYWADIVIPSDDFRGLHGLIVLEVWFSKRKYKQHYEPVIKVPIGYWNDHPTMHGKWYYYFETADIHRHLQRALMDAGEKIYERDNESESESEGESESESEGESA
jgi:hypothetical protein